MTTALVTKERPIQFSGPMIRAILEGRKSQARFLMRPQPPEWATFVNHMDKYALWQWSETEQSPPRPLRRWPEDECGPCYIPCPYGKYGDHLWVREAWRVRGGPEYEYQKHQPSVVYRASADTADAVCGQWKPSVFMRRWASRITLKVIGVRVVRLQEIREADCREEGFAGGHDSIRGYPFSATPLEHYRAAWTKINGAKGPRSWDANPWVWALEFTQVRD